MSPREDPAIMWLFSLNLLIIAFMVLLWALQRDQAHMLQEIQQQVQQCPAWER